MTDAEKAVMMLQGTPNACVILQPNTVWNVFDWVSPVDMFVKNKLDKPVKLTVWITEADA